MALLSGPGIEEEVNSEAVFAGPPGDIRKVIQQGDQAPGLDPGITIGVHLWGLGNSLSDNGTLLVVAYVAGPGVNETNDHAMWVGPRDGLQLVWREGMPAPGTESGVTFDWADLVVFNDAGEVAFRGGLEGPGIDDSNDVGRWLGGPGGLQLVTRAGDPAPGFPPGVMLAGAGGGLTSINTSGDANELTLLEGPGISADDDLVLYVGAPDSLSVVMREGGAAPEAGPDVELASIGTAHLSQRRQLFFRVKYAGPSIDDSNTWAMYFGPYDNPQVTLRDGDSAPHLSAGTVLARVVAAPALSALNDLADVVAVTEVAGPDVTLDDKVVLWLRDHLRAEWYPLLRGGMQVGGRVVAIFETGDLGSAICNKTGGSDGQPQSLNDAQELAIRIEFTDGTHGVYVLRLSWPGDDDSDGDVDLLDMAHFQTCFAGAGWPVDPAACGGMDVDEDEDVDFSDFTLLVEALTGSR